MDLSQSSRARPTVRRSFLSPPLPFLPLNAQQFPLPPSRSLDLVLNLFHDRLVRLGLLGRVVNGDARALGDADKTEEEVDGGQEVVLGLDNQTPAGPDEARGRQGGVLRQGELFGGTGKVGDAGEDERPLDN